MFKGIACALGACLIWGLIFVIPQFMSGFTAIEVTLGRYLLYGVVSLLIFLQLQLQGRCRYPGAVWKRAFYFSLISTIGYYTFVVLSLRYATPAISALILGVCPITIAFYGNFKQKETTFRSLLLPSALILLSLVIINVPQIQESASLSSYILGLVCCFLALTTWTWYVVANSRFLKNHKEVRLSDWSTLIGVATLAWVIVFTLILGVFFEDQLHMEKYVTFGPELVRFLIGSAILGILCSWVGASLWNGASLYLPVSLAGQLIIFETVFGISFVYLLEGHMPPVIESIGMAVLLIAVAYGVRQFAKNKAHRSLT
jgi:drug/metabolite transporter (DMT)-like permease